MTQRDPTPAAGQQLPNNLPESGCVVLGNWCSEVQCTYLCNLTYIVQIVQQLVTLGMRFHFRKDISIGCNMMEAVYGVLVQVEMCNACE